MSDLVEWLKNPSGDIFPRCREAADEIARLTLRVVELSEQLRASADEIARLRKERDNFQAGLVAAVAEIMTLRQAAAQIDRLRAEIQWLRKLGCGMDQG